MKKIQSLCRNEPSIVAVSLIAVIVAVIWFWSMPDVLFIMFLFLIALGTVVTSFATLKSKKQWIIIGTILSALSGFGASYFGYRGSVVESTALRKQLTEARNDMKVLIAATELKDRSLSLEKDEMQKRLAIVYKKLFDSLPGDADDWAKKFLDLQPMREQEYQDREQEIRERYAQEVAFIPVFFQLILRMFDERMAALSCNINGFKIEKLRDMPKSLFLIESEKDSGGSEIRAVGLPNGRTIEFSISMGIWDGETIKSYPGLNISEIPNPPKPFQNRWNIKLGITGCFMGACPSQYPTKNNKEEIEKYMEQLSKRLDNLISEALAHKPVQT